MDDEYNVHIRIKEYPVISETKTGVWILVYGEKKWVSLETKKRFAYPTPDEAYENFIKRTQRCIKILKSQLKRAESFLKADRPAEKSTYKLNEI